MAKAALVTKPKGSPYYYMDFDVGTQRITGPTNLRSKRAATAFAEEERRSEVARQEFASKVGPDMTLLAAIDRYMREVGQNIVSRRLAERSFDWLLDQLGENTPLREVNDKALAEAIAKRRRMHRFGNPEAPLVSNGTVNQEVTHMLQRVMVRARKVWKILLPDEPFWTAHVLPTKPRRREISLREEVVLCGARPDLAPIIRFILLSGLRKSEAIIRWSQVIDGEDVIKVETKDDGFHEVPITPDIQELLDDAWGNDKDFVFTYVAQHSIKRDGKYVRLKGQRYPLTNDNLYYHITTSSNKVGIEGLSVRDLRRTSGGRMHRATGDIGSVQEHLGHKNINITRRVYAHIPTKVRKERMEATAAYFAPRKAKVGERVGV